MVHPYGLIHLPNNSSITRMIKNQLNENLFDDYGMHVLTATIDSEDSKLKHPDSGGIVLYRINNITLEISNPERRL